MRRIIFIPICCMVLQSSGFAQETRSQKHIRFQSINQVGILGGSSEANLQLQTINGIKSKTWFAGLGIGLDYYYLRTAPIFIDVRKDIFNKAITPFIYADGGYHFAWPSKKEIDEQWRGEETKGGAYYELGIGYKTPVFKKMKLLFSAGYTYKHLSKTVNTMPWLSIWPPPREAYQHYEYSLRRVTIKAGISF